MPRSGKKREAAFPMRGAGKQLSGGAQILGFGGGGGDGSPPEAMRVSAWGLGQPRPGAGAGTHDTVGIVM